VTILGEERFWFLVCYDIRDPKRWRRSFKLLKGYGQSLQYSIFRCRLTRRQLEQIRWELERELAAEDSLMIASLCEGCASRLIARNTKVQWTELQPRSRII
jgi:CRISPR-associated protein Cas2